MQMIRHCIDQCWDVLQTVSDPEIRFYRLSIWA